MRFSTLFLFDFTKEEIMQYTERMLIEDRIAPLNQVITSIKVDKLSDTIGVESDSWDGGNHNTATEYMIK